MEFTQYLMAASSRTFLLGFDRSTGIFDKRDTPMALPQMHTFAFRPDELRHLLDGTTPDLLPEYWEYRRQNVVEKVHDRAKYGGEGILVEFQHDELEAPGFEYVYWDASPLMFGFMPGVAHVSNLYRMTAEDPLTIAEVNIDDLLL